MVGQGGDLLTARDLLRLERHGRELGAVVPLVDHLVGHDQMVLGVDRDLHIVANDAGSAPAGGHRTCVGVGQRDLLIRCGLNLLRHLLQGLHLATQAGNLLLQPAGLGLGDIALFAVGPVQCRQVTRDAGVDLPADGPGQLPAQRPYRTRTGVAAVSGRGEFAAQG
jgi:hypothetical protein